MTIRSNLDRFLKNACSFPGEMTWEASIRKELTLKRGQGLTSRGEGLFHLSRCKTLGSKQTIASWLMRSWSNCSRVRTSKRRILNRDSRSSNSRRGVMELVIGISIPEGLSGLPEAILPLAFGELYRGFSVGPSGCRM